MVIPLLEPLDIAGKTITADALLTQRKLARHLIERNADYVFTVKGNQPILREDIRLLFAGRGKPAFTEPLTLAHGRIEQRSIWTSTERVTAWVTGSGLDLCLRQKSGPDPARLFVTPRGF